MNVSIRKKAVAILIDTDIYMKRYYRYIEHSSRPYRIAGHMANYIKTNGSNLSMPRHQHKYKYWLHRTSSIYIFVWDIFREGFGVFAMYYRVRQLSSMLQFNPAEEQHPTIIR